MNKDDFTPYDLACFISLHGVFANPNSRVYDDAKSNVLLITKTVDLLFAELAKKKLNPT